MEEFQWFLMELSVRPGRYLAISAQRLPKVLWARNKIHSSCSLQSYFLISGFKWLCHRSLHCLPILPILNHFLPGRFSEIVVHFCAPYFWTSLMRYASSSVVQDRFFPNSSRRYTWRRPPRNCSWNNRQFPPSGRGCESRPASLAWTFEFKLK